MERLEHLLAGPFALAPEQATASAATIAQGALDGPMELPDLVSALERLHQAGAGHDPVAMAVELQEARVIHGSAESTVGAILRRRAA